MNTTVINESDSRETEAAAEFTIEQRETEGLSQGQIVRRRFFRHKGAMIGLAILLATIVLAFSSMGFGPVPGWWKHSGAAGPTFNPGGAPTLSLPTWLGGSGFACTTGPKSGVSTSNVRVVVVAAEPRGAAMRVPPPAATPGLGIGVC